MLTITPPSEKRVRAFALEKQPSILYVRHLGQEPYNEIKFECGKKIIVSGSLGYWHRVFQDFERINKGVLINPCKVVSELGKKEVVLTDKSIFQFSRRSLMSFRRQLRFQELC
jgi:hypothetical protein